MAIKWTDREEEELQEIIEALMGNCEEFLEGTDSES
ncbi:MAG: hypothetical protein G01um10142_162 [Parcubacteria group bacterium Gr01-1014_2]|nr:MAG: hypothetical protein G01um10142_162 [Parcubacteria group bacterium Gr01-1014_2]